MKTQITAILILLFAFSQLRAQEFKVIHVNGTIIAKSTRSSLKRGSAFGEQEKFQYKTNGARAVVINPKKGQRFILKNNRADTSFRRANLTPSAGNISSRAGALVNRLDLQNHFNGKYVILGESLKVVINSAAFPMNKDNFFYIQYVYKNEKINKKLYHSGDTLIIYRDSLLRVDGKPVKNEDITDMRLIYVSKIDGKLFQSVISSTFYPVFPDNDILKEEVAIIRDAMKGKTEDEIINAIDSYIADVYGKPNKDNVRAWYKAGFKK